MTRRRVVIGILLLGLLFALQGGEYSTLDFLSLRRQVAAESTQIAELEHLTDSLERRARAVETDPAVQERLARELYGMVRPGEKVYSIIWDEPR